MSEFVFEQTPWEAYLDTCGDRGEAEALLTCLEEETEDTVQWVLDSLTRKKIRLDISGLPVLPQSGELARRLTFEKKIAGETDLISNLRDTDPLRLYLEEISGIPVTGTWDADLERHLSGDSRASERLVNAMLSHVIEEARSFAGQGVLLLDLIQEGSLGLWQAIGDYREGNFEEHCIFYIRQAMAGAIFLQARAAGLGQKLRQGMQDYQDADQKLLTELGRNPTPEEIAEQLHMDPQEAAILERMLISAKARQQYTREQTRQEEDEEEQQAVEDTAYFQSRQRVLDMLSDLTEQEAKLITLRFGLEGGLPLTTQETGEKLGLTAQQVVELEAAALQKMRTSNETGGNYGKDI